ncbi:MAG: hypothetical protein ACQEXQ_15880 [Bacillota bacterium]
MSLMKEIDWQMLSYVGLSLVQEYLINIHYPKIYYWSGQRDYSKME